WEMLTGRRLFRGKEHKETIKLIVSMAIPLPSSINHDVPPSVDAICMKALSRDPNTRYQTTGALLGELSRAADQLPQRAATRDLSVYMRRQFGPGVPGYGASRTSSPRRNPVPPAEDAEKRARLSRTTGDRIPVGQLLMEQGALAAQDLDVALAEQRARGGRIGELLVASGTVTEDDLLQAISSQANLPSIGEDDLLALSPPTKLLQRFPKEAAEATLILPISINEQQRSVGLAVNDPYDERAILETKVVLGVNDVVTFLAKRTAIRAAIDAWYVDEEEEVDDDAIIYESPVFEDAVEVVDGSPVVLIADADREQAEALAARVREEDCTVIVASDGKDARSLCREGRPIVAFLDASLPGIDGYNLLLELRSRNEDAAVFITSNRGDEFRQAKALELGADDFIVKPYSLEVVTSKIRREIKRRGGIQQVRAPTVQFEGVSGSLKDMTALDIIQGLELGRKTAHVVLQYEDGRSGELRLDQGQVGGSIMGTQSGEAAFYGLTRHGRGLFRIEYRSSPLPRNIIKPNTYLMIEAMRQLDESLSSVPRTNPLGAPNSSVAHARLHHQPPRTAPPVVVTDDLSVDTPRAPVPIQLEPTPPRLTRPQDASDGRTTSLRRAT
ncbi:MAG: response regulator, partial [Myxococcota bacterium]